MMRIRFSNPRSWLLDQGVKHFLERYKKGGLRDDGWPKLDDYGFSTDTVWKASFSALEEHRTNDEEPCHGLHLLGVIAFLSPDNISNGIFTGHNPDSYPPVLSFCQKEEDFEAAAKELAEMALIDSSLGHKVHSIHRLVQEAFERFLDDPSRQLYFDYAVMLLYEAFLQQVEGHHYKDSQSLDRFYRFYHSDIKLTNNRYLHEIGDKASALAIASLAMSTCKERDSLLYAHLFNTMFGIYFELNDLKKARSHCEVALEIRKRLDTEEEYSNTLSNMGNLLSAEGRLAEALRCFEESESIRQRIGEDGIIGHALLCLGIGRAQALTGDYDPAEPRSSTAKEEILRVFGPQGHSKPDVHSAFGNLARRNRDLPTARTHYPDGLRVLQAQRTPTHAFHAAFLYKLACISVAAAGLPPAMEMLAKASTLAAHSPDGTPGDVARILHAQASLLQRVGYPPSSPEVAQKASVAAQLREMVEREYLPDREGGDVVVETQRKDGGGEGEGDPKREGEWDRLVGALMR
ncbi:hypothetical protein MMC30_007769 [Trapelia coarctata]|nr:hypothetical protein [Trapelia coarctata]